MPTTYFESYAERCARWRRLEAVVRAKYPAIIVGSSGWDRAIKAMRSKVR
jgi:hypothetical protein